MEQEAFAEDSPHFVDEESLRGARPVVPLEEIPSGDPQRKFAMALALLLAVGLGAGVALLIVQLRQPVVVQSSITPNPASTPKTADQAAPAVDDEEEMMDLSETEKAEEAEQSEDIDTEVIQARDEKPRRTTVPPRIVPRTRNSDNNIRSSGSDRPDAIAQVKNDEAPKPVLVEDWEEKRSRRVMRQVERDRANARRPDLFRIREIFEGSRP